MANLITSIRLLLLFVLVTATYHAPPVWQLTLPFLLIFIIVLDAVDGHVARRRGETTVFGSIYDIAVDRIVENVLWIVLADLDLIPVWVALLFVTRGLLVDSIRGHGVAQGKTAFGMMESAWGRFLVAGRFMRGFYGTIKATTFAWILLFHPVPVLLPQHWVNWSPLVSVITETLVYTSTAICLLRGIPVLLECYLAGIRSREPKPLEET